MNIKYIITQCLLFISLTVSAHQPDLSSTILVEKEENQWVLQIRAALTAFEYEVEAQYGKDAFSTPEEFRELVIEHVENNMHIQFDEDIEPTLTKGKVNLGHETTVTFNVMTAPSDFQTLNVKNSSFSDIPRNQSALIVLKEGYSKNQFVLNNDNEHTAKLKLTNSKIESITPLQSKTPSSFTLYLGVLLVLIMIVFAIKKWQIFKFNSLLQKT